MSRSFGLVAVICSLAIVAALMALNARENGPTSQTFQRAKTEGKAAVSSLNFTQAATELEAYRAEHGTYAGATLPPAFGVVVVRGDVSAYCLQAGVGGTTQHFTGPGGPAATGPC